MRHNWRTFQLNRCREKMEKHFNSYTITDSKERIDIEKVCSLLKSSYWASERPKEKILKSIEHSICISVFEDTEQVGFARVVTDYSLFSWIADVIVDPDHQGKEIGKEGQRKVIS